MLWRGSRECIPIRSIYHIPTGSCCRFALYPHGFQLDLLYKGRAPAIKEQIVDMSLNGSGIRDTARVLQISPTTVINALKKRAYTHLRAPTAPPQVAPW
jgi:hypothetical protein